MGYWEYHEEAAPSEAQDFWVPGPISGSEVLERWKDAFPADTAVVVCRADKSERHLSWGGLADVVIGPDERLGLPEAPFGVGPLAYVMTRLLGEGGCPWDREQTSQSLLPFLLDEAYEAAEALVAEDWPAFGDELGDVLLQVVFHAALLGNGFDAVAKGQAAKLVRRHPHVFAEDRLESADQVLAKWETLKAKEAGHERSAVFVWPSLAAAKRLAKRGILPEDPNFHRFREALAVYVGEDPGKIQENLGNIAWALADLGRSVHCDAEWALWRRLAEEQLKFMKKPGFNAENPPGTGNGEKDFQDR